MEFSAEHRRILQCADYWILAKLGIKQIVEKLGLTATFAAKPFENSPGSSCHFHISLTHGNEDPAFHDPDKPYDMSDVMCYFLAGLLKYTKDNMLLFAPYACSYDRFKEGTFAPTNITWAIDNRTIAHRVCGAGTKKRSYRMSYPRC